MKSFTYKEMEENKILVFDLDGTLINSMPYFSAAMRSILDDKNIPYGEDLVDIVTPLGYRKSAEYFSSLGAGDDVDAIVKKIETRLVYEYSNNIKLKDGVREYLKKSKNEGKRLFVLTASPHLVVDVCLENNGVYDLFDEVWSVDDFSFTKSTPDIFIEMSERIGVDPEQITFFDDNHTALINGKKAGHRVVGVRDIQKEETVKEIKNTVHKFIDSFNELL